VLETVGHHDKYRTFRVLLDEPAVNPVLGFDDYAEAFADIIVESKPQFAIGIFGDWGSGKTTLMRALAAALGRRDLGPPTATESRSPAPDRSGDAGDSLFAGIRRRFGRNEPNGANYGDARAFIIPVWFNAWRYEREEHLIVPLLDTLREGLATAAVDDATGAEATRLRNAAATVGRAARALAAGLTVKASLTPVDVQFDPKRAMDAWTDHDAAANEPLSFYHSTFREMKSAIAEVTRDGRSRVVIFIDDLDRCLPLNALEVLESMKLFFDLEGFVFVVGLDQSVIERSIEMKYQPAASRSASESGDGARGGAATQPKEQAPADGRAQWSPAGPRRNAPVTGAEYIKKLFQVPFTVPRVNSGDLERFFDSIIATNDLPAEQRTDLTEVVKRHLVVATSAESGSVNPREVKRLINAYTLQMKMLSAKLEDTPDPNIVVALQTMAFRPDWRDLYDLLVAAPEVFAAAVRQVRDDPLRRTEFPLRNEPLPTTFLDYVRGPASALLDDVSLEPYVTSAESFGSTNPAVAEARTIVVRLQRLVASLVAGSAVESEALEELRAKTSQLYSAIDRGSSSSSPQQFDAYQLVNDLQLETSKILPRDPGAAAGPPKWAPRVLDLLDSIERSLREVRRQANVTAAS
jgi:hypothetical protein